MGDRRGTRVALAAVAALTLAGCAGASSDLPVPFGTHQLGPDAPEAQIAGTLMLVDGCLIVEDPWDYTNPVALPDVAVWDEQAQTVKIDGVAYAVGDEVDWGGGYYSDREAVNLPATCPTDSEIAVVFTTS